jgi:hypothetical protein
VKNDVTPQAVERAARLYNSNALAAEALGISRSGFARMCRRYGLETPYARRQRERRRTAPHAGI